MLTVTVRISGTPFSGTVSETNFSRNGVLVDADFDRSIPILPIGARIDTALHGPSAQAPVSLQARVVFQAKSEVFVRCGFSYPVEDLPSVRNMLNNRRAVRVAPSPSLPLKASVPEGVDVQVNDISTGGVALLLAEESQRQLSGWAIRVNLRLPEQDWLDMHGQIRIRKLVGAMIVYGIEFDERTPDFVQKTNLIHRYVMQRQAEILRERSQRIYIA